MPVQKHGADHGPLGPDPITVPPSTIPWAAIGTLTTKVVGSGTGYDWGRIAPITTGSMGTNDSDVFVYGQEVPTGFDTIGIKQSGMYFFQWMARVRTNGGTKIPATIITSLASGKTNLTTAWGSSHASYPGAGVLTSGPFGFFKQAGTTHTVLSSTEPYYVGGCAMHYSTPGYNLAGGTTFPEYHTFQINTNDGDEEWAFTYLHLDVFRLGDT